jgi:hypothetical protein
VEILFEEGNLVLLLGAGASVDSGLPAGDRAARLLVEGIFSLFQIKLCDDQISEWPRLEVVIDYLDKYESGSALSIVKTFAGIGFSPTIQTLAKRSKPGWLWLTTNFDDLT